MSTRKAFKALPVERRAFLDEWTPRAQFHLPSTLSGEEYRMWLDQLLRRFLISADDNYGRSSEFALDCESGHETGISPVCIDGLVFGYSKLYWYDTDPKNHYSLLPGLLFRDHEQFRSHRTFEIYLLADAFEAFLKREGIPFQRVGQKRDDRINVLQTSFPEGHFETTDT